MKISDIPYYLAHFDLEDIPIINPQEEEKKQEEYGALLFEKRKRSGMTLSEGIRLMRSRNYYGPMMVELGEADALISGLTINYPKTIRPALQIIGVEEGFRKVAGMYIILHKTGSYFFSDTTVNVDPSVEDLVEIIELTSRAVKFFGVEPRIGVISYSNFGSNRGEIPDKAREAVKQAKEKFPDLIIDGELQANVAFRIL